MSASDVVEAPLGLRLAIADPGGILPRNRQSGESVAGWSARAVVASPWLADLLAAERERIAQELETEARLYNVPHSSFYAAIARTPPQ